MATRDRDDREESPIYVILVLGLVLLVFVALAWLIASNKIVYGSLKPLLAVAAAWKLIPTDFTYRQWNEIVEAVVRFSGNPAGVGFFEWGGVVNRAIWPGVVFVCLGFIAALVYLGVRRKPTLQRRLTAQQVMEQSAMHFTGIAPVVALRKQIASDQHPLWRRQVAPEEVFLSYKVPRTKAPSNGSLATVGAPMVRQGAFDREVARAYFIGAQELLPDGRLVSSMLGRQLVNLPVDAKKAKGIVFADRMSSEGKALLALWAAVAFGGKQGRDEYCDYRDQLNRSAYKTKDGIANLALAQPLYERYRKHPLVNKLFAVHHWEHTFLFALLELAQKRGRYTTAEVLWLRPLNRVMFFSMNTRGAPTPHTEAAATFAQHAYEVSVGRLGRLPLMRDGGGAMVHVIFVNKAVDGLELEALRWFDADEQDGDDWWTNKDIWKRSSQAISHAEAMLNAAVPTAPPPGFGESGDTPFDQMQRAQTAEEVQRDEMRRNKLVKDMPMDDFGDFLSGAAASSSKGF